MVRWRLVTHAALCSDDGHGGFCRPHKKQTTRLLPRKQIPLMASPEDRTANHNSTYPTSWAMDSCNNGTLTGKPSTQQTRTEHARTHARTMPHYRTQHKHTHPTTTQASLHRLLCVRHVHGSSMERGRPFKCSMRCLWHTTITVDTTSGNASSNPPPKKNTHTHPTHTHTHTALLQTHAMNQHCHSVLHHATTPPANSQHSFCF